MRGRSVPTLFKALQVAGRPTELVGPLSERQLSNSLSGSSGMPLARAYANITQPQRPLSCEAGQPFLQGITTEGVLHTQPWQHLCKRGKLTVKSTTKSHRFTIHIKIDRELAIRSYWRDVRGVTDPALLQRFVNFARVYARYRDLDYLKHTMRDWDAAINRLFDHVRGMEPANNLARKHPYVLNVKIHPLVFAKEAVKGNLPLYDWRTVLQDLKRDVGAPEGDALVPKKKSASEDGALPLSSFRHAKKKSAVFLV